MRISSILRSSARRAAIRVCAFRLQVQLIRATLLALIGMNVFAADSASLALQRKQYMEYTEQSVCEPMQMFVGSYLAFRLTGEDEIQSRQRYQQVRDAHSPYRMAIEDLGMNEQQAKYYAALNERGAGMADKFLESLRQDIEGKVSKFRKTFPPEFKNGQVLGSTADAEDAKQRIEEHYRKAARTMCKSVVQSTIADEFKRKSLDR